MKELKDKDMNVVRVKSGQNRSEVIRMQNVVRRMVGMYRLLSEQSDGERYNTLKEVRATIGPKGNWQKFRETYSKVLTERLTGEAPMKGFIVKSRQEKVGLSGLLWDIDKDELPKQAIAIRLGAIMETAIVEYASGNCTDWRHRLAAPLAKFSGGGIQIDLAVERDGVLLISELKYNLNLDTEKSRAIVEKLDTYNNFIKDFISAKGYTNLVPNISLVSLTYPTADRIKGMKSSLQAVSSNYVLGYQELFNFLDINVTERMWRRFHQEVIIKEVENSFERYKDEV